MAQWSIFSLKIPLFSFGEYFNESFISSLSDLRSKSQLKIQNFCNPKYLFLLQTFCLVHYSPSIYIHTWKRKFECTSKTLPQKAKFSKLFPCSCKDLKTNIHSWTDRQIDRMTNRQTNMAKSSGRLQNPKAQESNYTE